MQWIFFEENFEILVFWNAFFTISITFPSNSRFHHGWRKFIGEHGVNQIKVVKEEKIDFDVPKNNLSLS